jgi:hypothetical protein
MYKNKLALVGVVLLFILGGGIFLFVSKTETVERNYTAVRENVQYARPNLSENTLTYFSGTFFNRINLKNLSATVISDPLFISSPIEQVSYSENFVLFRSNPLESDRDDLSTIVEKASPELAGQPNWWRYNLSEKRYELIRFGGAHKCKDFVLANTTKGLCIMGTGNAGDSLMLFDFSTKKTTQLFSSEDPISNPKVGGDSVYVVVSKLDNTQLIKKTVIQSKQSEEINLGKSKILSYEVTADTMLADTIPSADPTDAEADHDHDVEPEEPSEHKIYFYKTGSKNKSIKIKTEQLNIYVNNDEYVVGKSDGGLLKISSSGKSTELEMASKVGIEKGAKLFSGQDGVMYQIDPNGVLSTSAEVTFPENYRAVGTFDQQSDNAADGQSWIVPVESNHLKAYVFNSKQSASTQVIGIFGDLKKKGFLIEEIKFEWVLEGLDYSIPLTPKYVVY